MGVYLYTTSAYLLLLLLLQLLLLSRFVICLTHFPEITLGRDPYTCPVTEPTALMLMCSCQPLTSTEKK